MAELSVEPPVAQVPAEGGASRHELTNNTEVRLAIKIKCSDNDLYRVQPVYAFVNPQEPLGVDVQRLAGEPKEDRLVIQYVAAGEEVADPKDLFPVGGAFPELTLPLSAQ